MAKGKYIINEGYGYGSYGVTGTNYDDTITNYQGWADVNASKGNDEVTNWAYSAKVYGEDGDDLIVNRDTAYALYGFGPCVLDGGKGNDTIVNEGRGTEIYGGVGNDIISLNGGWATIIYNEGDGNDVIYGFITDGGGENFNGILQIGDGDGTYSTAATDDGDVIISAYNGKITLVGAGMCPDEYIWDHVRGYCVDNYIKELTDASNKYKNTMGNATILALGGNDSVYNDAANVSINGGAGKDTLVSTAKATTLEGGAGDDLIMLKYLSSDNVIIYNSGDGKDTIKGFDESDTLQIGNGTGTYSTTKSGADIIVTVGTGKITIVGGADLDELNIAGTKKSSTTLTLKDSNDSAIKIGSTITKVNATSRTKAIKITGNSLNNSIGGGSKNDTIYGGEGKDTIQGNAGNDKLYGQAGNDKIYGGKGNDSLWGGAGNDSLWGNSGKDVFIYKPGEGTDKIMDYWHGDGDMLKILKTNGKEGGTFKKSVFDGDSLTLTINGGGTVIFDEVSAGDKFNINGKTYTLKGRTLK